MKNLNVRKKIVAGLIAAGIGLSLCNCQKKVTIDISTKTTLGTTLDSISEYTDLDEILRSFNYVEEDGTEYSFDELTEMYHEARVNGDLSKANYYIYRIGSMILKASLSEQLDIDCNSIKGIDYTSTDGEIIVNYDETQIEELPGDLQVPHVEEKSKTIYASGELSNLLINVNRARVHGLEFETSSYLDTDIDHVYMSFERYMCTSGTLKNSFGETYLTMKLDEAKVKSYNKIK